MSPVGLAWTAIGGLLLCLTSGAIAGDLMQPDPWERCYYCHGEQPGAGSPPVPVIHGQPSAYLEKQLADFRSGRRPDPDKMMQSVATLLTSEELQSVVAHFARLPVPEQRMRPRSADGRNLYGRGRDEIAACIGCHEQLSAGPDAPYLRGQSRGYLVAQLQAFREGVRRNDEGAVMREIARRLTDVDIDALVDYLGAE